MTLTILTGAALIIALVALYYTSKTYELAQAAIQILIAAEIVDVKYVDEEDED